MLHIHRSHRTEVLVEALAALLAQGRDDDDADPMGSERLLVGSRGIERWLAAELARRSPAGVFAGVEVDFPSRFVDRLVEDVVGERDRHAVDPWDPDALVWTIAGRLPDAIADDPDVFPAVARYLTIEARETDVGVDDGTGQLAFPMTEEVVARGFVVDRKLLGFAGQTAELFDRYNLHRPDMVRRWARGQDVDDRRRPLGDQQWQAELWRAIAAEQRSVASPPARIAAAVEALDKGRELSDDVPQRLVGFGIASLPPLQLDLLAAVARQRDVHLFVPSPSPALWQLGWQGAPADQQPSNALLRASGPVGRHAAHNLREVATERGTRVTGGTTTDGPTHGSAPLRPPASTSLLARLQDDIATDTPLPDEPDGSLPAAEQDRSIVFHDGHGAVRQVEALQDELRRRFDADPTLQPRDVVVLTPDLPTYAPLVQAVFADPRGRFPDGRPVPRDRTDAADGDDAAPDPPTIPVAVGDRSAGLGNPVASVLTQLLDLVHARTSGAEVLDLLSTEPVRARFRISPRELETVQRWIEDTGVAWARDEDDRARQGEPRRREHTWAAALDRLLLGVAMTEDGDRLLDGVVPYDGIEDSADLDLLDRLTRFLDVVDSLVTLERPRFLDDWAATLADLLDEVTGPATGLPWQTEAERNEHRRHRERVDRVLSGLERANDTLARDVEVRALARWLGNALDEAGISPAGHGTGAVTVAELVPLRAIPFRVVCLLGMDTGAFPRGETPPGHDLAARDPRPGDRDRRAEDRALFLDAIHAAQQALVVCYAGRDPVSGRDQPPAIPVAELRDAVEAYVGTQGVKDRTTVHPVLPTGPAAFDATTPQGPVSYDRVRLGAARVAQRDQRVPPPFLVEPLPAPDGDGVDVEPLSLDQLTRVVAKPAQALLDHLRIARPEDLRTFPETEPLELDALEKWQLGTQLLDEADDVSGSERTFDDVLRTTLATGRLPAGAVGRHVVSDVVEIARDMTACLDTLGPREHRDVEVEVAGRRIEGRLRLAVGERTQLVETWYGRPDGRRHLRARLRHLVGCIALADDEPRSVIQARARYGSGIDRFVQPCVAPDVAERELARWVELYERAPRERVPFVAKISWDYAEHRRTAERRAATADGVDLADVEGLSDFELVMAHGQTGKGKSTVHAAVDKALDEAHDTWGRDDDNAYGFPLRDDHAIRLVFRDLRDFNALVEQTDLLGTALRLLRPLADAIDAGSAEAREVGP